MDERTLKNLKGLHRSYWESASFSERLNALQKLEDYQARQQGRYRYEVKAFEPDDPGYKGLFVLDDNELEGTIYVNQEHIADSGFQYEAINTVLHEGRHAYQFFSADRGLHHDPFEEERWIVNSANYVNPSDYVKYFFQPMERDAHYFSREEMNRVFSVLESEFGKSEHFDTYATLRDQQFQSIEKRAEERYGRDFIQKIDRAIGYDETQARENLIEAGRIEPEPKVVDKAPQLELHAEAEAAFHERARYQEQLEKLEERFEKEPSPELSEQVQSMKEGLQTYMDREGETWGDYVKATEGKGQKGLIVDAQQNNVVIEATLRNGAYVRPADDRTNLGYVPFTKDENGYNRIDGEKIQWNRNQKINLSIETDKKRGQYIKLESKDKGASARAYLDGEAKPFKELKNQWEMEGKTFEMNRDRGIGKDRGMEM